MAWTQAQLTALEEAIAEGALKVAYEDRTITYRSQSEMLQLRGAMRKALGLAGGGRVFSLSAMNKGTTSNPGPRGIG